MHIAIALKTNEKLLPSLKYLEKELIKKSKKFKKIVKVGRTHYKMQLPYIRSRVFWLSCSIKKMYNQNRSCVKRNLLFSSKWNSCWYWIEY